MYQEQFSADASSHTSSVSRQAYPPQSDSDPSTPGQFTPLSTSTASRTTSSSGHLRTTDEVEHDPDVPLPSIERESGRSVSLGIHGNLTSRPRTPSFSITPPASEGIATPTPSFAPTFRTSPTPSSAVDSINERIGNLGLATEFATRQASAQNDTTAGYRPSSSISAASAPDTPAPSVSSTESDRALIGRESGSRPHSQTTPPGERQHARSATVSGITNGLENMTFGGEASHPTSATPGTYLSPVSPSPDRTNDDATARSRSASRHRSGSHVDKTPHNVADEEPPQDRFHEPAFQQAFANAKSLVAQLIDVLARSSLHNEPDSSIRRLYLQANDLGRFQCPSTRTVGLVGDSGVGKSSLINSLLDFQSLARTSNSGAACTCVVTEYHYHDSGDFGIEVEYFTMDQIKHQFAELLQSYRQYHLHGDGMSAEDRKDFEEKAKAAQDTFRAAFRSYLIENEQSLLDWPEAAALETLLTWTRESGPPLMEGSDGIQRREVVANVEQCSRRLMELTSEPNSIIEPSVWPFIRKIKVYLKAYILSKGLILVDLPGLRDLNSARLKITERYLLYCDEILAICYIGRATTDAGVEGVFDLAQRADLSHIGIVCTKSDDVRADEAERDSEGQAAATIKRMVAAIATDQRNIEMIDAEIEEVDGGSDADDERPGEEYQEISRLNRRLKNAKKLMNQHIFELKSHLINTRNQHVTNALRQNYQNRIPGGDLKVFGVSNTDYWEHREKPKEDALPALRLSRIIDVRRHCISIVAESQLRAATEYVKDVIPALLGSIQLWVQSGSGNMSAERKQAVRNALDEVERGLLGLKLAASPINVIAQSMERRFREQLSRIMTRFTYQWSQAAGNASLAWQGSASYSAFCRKYGDYYTTTVLKHCWNDEAMTAMVTYMDTPWQAFRQDLQTLQSDNSGLIENTFDRAIALTNCDGIPTDSIVILTASLRRRQSLLLSHVEQLCETFQNGLSVLKTDAFSGIRSSIMGQLMEESYVACQRECGSGSDKRRKAIIQARFSDEGLFESLQRQFRDKFSTLARDLENKIKEAITTHLDAVQTDLDFLRNENVMEESERHPEFRMQVAGEVERVKGEMANIHEDMIARGY